MNRFRDRVDAGRRLAPLLLRYRRSDVVVLGLPRGGVPVAAEVARALGAPLDILVVRKLPYPAQPELAMGAVGEDGVVVIDDDIVRETGVPAEVLDRVAQEQRIELESRVLRWRSGRPRLDLTGRTAIIVDDGIATGSTVRAACRVARGLGASRVVVATPVAAHASLRHLTDADDVACLTTPHRFTAVGAYYDDFRATTDDEVDALLDAGRRS